MSFFLRLLGEPVLQGPSGLVPLKATKLNALCLFLAARSGEALSRGRLCAVLWEDLPEANGRAALSVILNQIRREWPVFPLRTDKDTIGWDPSLVDVDILRFETLVNRGDLLAAITLWRGMLLEGFNLSGCQSFDQWIQSQRRDWDERILSLLTDATARAEADRDWDQSARLSRLALTIDPLRENFHRMLMMALGRSGQRSAALAQYEFYRRLLREELGVEPEGATLILREAIASGGSYPASPSRILLAGPIPLQPSDHPLNGRAAELDRLEMALSASRSGQKPLTLIHGEAGIGKTRLLEEILRRQTTCPSPPYRSILFGQCHLSTSTLPFAPLIGVLETLVADLDISSLNLPPVWLGEVARLLPDLGVNPPALQVGEDPTLERQRLYEGLCRFLEALPSPLLLALEDIHWGDEATLSVIAYLGRRPKRTTVSILLTARDGDLPESSRDLARRLEREGRLTWLELGPLARSALGELTTAFLGQPNDVLAGRLYDRTRGHPFFSIEILRSLREKGQLNDPAAMTAKAVPLSVTVQSVIESRLACLPKAEQEFLQAASICQEPAPFHLVGSIADLSVKVALEAMEKTIKAGFLREEGLGPKKKIGFAHDLVCQVIENRLSRTKVEVLNQRAYHYMAEDAARGDGLPLNTINKLAFHAKHGRLWEEALAWNLQGTAAATQITAKVKFMQEALACLEELPPTHEQLEQGVVVRLQLASAYFPIDFKEVFPLLDAAENLAKELGNELHLLTVQIAQATAIMYKGRPAEALDLIEAVIPALEVRNLSSLFAHALWVNGIILIRLGRYTQATSVLGEAATLNQQNGDVLQTWNCHSLAALCHIVLGNFPQAERILAEISLLSRQAEDTATATFCLAYQSIRAGWQGRWQDALAASMEARRLALETGFPFLIYTSNIFYGPALAKLGRLDEAIQVQKENIQDAIENRDGNWLALSYAWLGETLLNAGRLAEAEAAIQQGYNLALSQSLKLDQAVATKFMGRLAQIRGDKTKAREQFKRALTVFLELGARPDAARCHALLAEVAETPAEVDIHRQEAERSFRAMGMDWNLQPLTTKEPR